MKKKLSVGLATGLFLVSVVGMAEATLINSALDSALIGASIIDFQDTTEGTYATITIDDVIFSADDNHLRITDIFGHPPYELPTRQGNYLDNGDYSNNGFSSITFNFSYIINAFGFGWNDGNNIWTLSAYDSLNNLLESRTISQNSGFFGLAVENISYATLANAGEFDWIAIDNLSYSAAPVPEPATMLLFGTGLAGFVGTRIRRKKK